MLKKIYSKFIKVLFTLSPFLILLIGILGFFWFCLCINNLYNKQNKLANKLSIKEFLATNYQGQEFFNVVDDGADPTGKNDSTSAIQETLNKANSSSNDIGLGQVHMGIDNRSPGIKKISSNGGIVVFPKGRYLISNTLVCRNVRIMGSLGTEIKFKLPDNPVKSCEAFHLYGQCAIENLWLDTYCTTNSQNEIQDAPYGIAPKEDITWFVAKNNPTDNYNTEGSWSQIILYNLRTTRYADSGSCKTFFRNDHEYLTFFAQNIWFATWKYGFHFTGSADWFSLINVIGVASGVGSNETGSYFDSESSFIFSDPSPTIQNPNRGNGILLDSCYCSGFFNGFRMKGAHPAYHSFQVSNSTFEQNRRSVVIEDRASPLINMSNCNFYSAEYGVLGAGDPPDIDKFPDNFLERRIFFDNCTFSFRNPDLDLFRNQRHIWLSNRNIPITIVNCLFGGPVDPVSSENIPELVLISFNKNAGVIFSNNQMNDIQNKEIRDYISYPIRFYCPDAPVIFSNNIINVKGSKYNASIGYDDLTTTNARFIAIGNYSLGNILIWPPNSSLDKYNISSNLIFLGKK